MRVTPPHIGCVALCLVVVLLCACFCAHVLTNYQSSVKSVFCSNVALVLLLYSTVHTLQVLCSLCSCVSLAKHSNADHSVARWLTPLTEKQCPQPLRAYVCSKFVHVKYTLH